MYIIRGCSIVCALKGYGVLVDRISKTALQLECHSFRFGGNNLTPPTSLLRKAGGIQPRCSIGSF